MQSDKYGSHFKRWARDGANLKSLAAGVKEYAYRPFSQNWDENSIDPRTYFFADEFLYQKQRECNTTGDCSLAIITTWAQNLTQARDLEPRGMPFNINNIDASVVADQILAVVMAQLNEITDDNEWFDEE